MSDGARINLRSYQRESVDFLVHSGRGVCGDEMGLGKTPVGIVAACESLFGPGANEAFLVLAPNVAIGVWDRHIRDLLQIEPMIYAGTPAQRRNLTLSTSRITIAPYSMVAELHDRLPRARWPLIIADEAHIMRHRTTQVFDNVRRLRSDLIFLLSGSPIVDNSHDLWTLLHLCNSAKFNSYWNFIKEWFQWGKGYFGGIDAAPVPVDKAAFKMMLREYLIRHTKKAVLPELPPKVRRALPIKLYPAQRKLYDAIATDMMAESGGRLILTPTQLTQIMMLRQICVTPALIGEPHKSAAFDALAESLTNEFDARRACLVFTPFREAIPYLTQLADDLKLDHYGVIVGGMGWKRTQAVVDKFEACKSKKKAIFATVQSGTSWTATSASSVFFLNFDWLPNTNWQAEDRVHRIGQEDSVIANYFINEGTIDEHIMDILDKRRGWNDIAFDAKGLLLPRYA